MNNGGSPRGVNKPPQFATIPIKNNIVWTLNVLCLFVWITGRISNIAAPVVPIMEARTAPIPRNNVLTLGFAAISPVNKIPPVIVNNAPSKIKNGT